MHYTKLGLGDGLLMCYKDSNYLDLDVNVSVAYKIIIKDHIRP